MELQNRLEELQRERDELDHECNEIQEKHGLAVLNIQKLEEKIELLEQQTAIFPSEVAFATSEHLEEIEELRRQVAAPARELPEPAIIFNRLKDKRPKSKAVLKDIELAMELMEES